MRYILGFLIMSLTISFGQTTKKTDAPSSIELYDFVSMFMLPDSGHANIGDWFTGAEENDPIEWITDGIKDTENQEDYSYERIGSALISVDGKFKTRLGKKKEKMPWEIKLLGPRAGYLTLEFGSYDSFFGFESWDAIKSLKKRGMQLKEIKCGDYNGASEGEIIYVITAKQKKSAWLYFGYSGGSGGESFMMKLFVNEPKLDTYIDCPEY